MPGVDADAFAVGAALVTDLLAVTPMLLWMPPRDGWALLWFLWLAAVSAKAGFDHARAIERLRL